MFEAPILLFSSIFPFKPNKGKRIFYFFFGLPFLSLLLLSSKQTLKVRNNRHGRRSIGTGNSGSCLFRVWQIPIHFYPIRFWLSGHCNSPFSLNVVFYKLRLYVILHFPWCCFLENWKLRLYKNFMLYYFYVHDGPLWYRSFTYSMAHCTYGLCSNLIAGKPTHWKVNPNPPTWK